MSTAVAEVRPAAYGFPAGSGKESGGDHDEVLSSVGIGKRRSSDGFFIAEDEEVLTENSSVGAPSPSGSSIGENSSSEAGGDEGEEEEVESKLKEGDDRLGCLDALEDSLPIKSGLSSFYSGKSKSFTSLAEATSTVTAAAKELAKPENPFNKRRRILANWSRRASCSSLATATYLPPLLAPDHAVAEGNEGEEDDSDDEYEYNHLPHRGKNCSNVPAALPLPPPRLGDHTQMGLERRKGHGSFRSPRSFSLSDLQNSRHTGTSN